MNQAAAYQAIRNAWEASWPTLSGNVPFVYDNEGADGAATYVRFSIQSLNSENWTIGGASNLRQKRHGIVNVKINTATDAGRTPNDALGQFVRTIFERKRLSASPGDDVVCLECSAREAGDDGQYWTQIFAVRFYFHEAGG